MTVRYNHLDIVKYLISMNAEPDINIIYKAIVQNNLTILEYLVFTEAIMHGRLNIVQYLVSIGIQPSKHDILLMF